MPTEMIVVKVPVSLKRSIETVAAANDRTVSQEIRRVLKQAFPGEVQPVAIDCGEVTR